jgi:23S rRNA (cytosine1962-C5)-methyltransferase
VALKTLNLGRDLERPIASGHPWVYRDALPRHSLATGEWVRLEAGKAVAFGLYDQEGAIAVRLFSRRSLPDGDWFTERVREALALRAGFEAKGTDAYRLIHGEGDGLPAMVVDRYGRHAVLKVYSEAVRPAVAPVIKALTKALELRGVSERTEAGLARRYGELPPPELTVGENGLRLLANLHEGQKTGLFLDQRDNRATVRSMAAGREVLNLFAYNGGFSVAALAGGATRAVSVDIAPAALHDAERTVELNGFTRQQHQVVAADVFEFLKDGGDRRRGAAAGRGSAPGDGRPRVDEEGGARHLEGVFEGRRFDLVVCDPPSLAHSKRGRHAALRSYRRLNASALRRVSAGGLLATSSCTAQVSPEAFRQVLGEAAAEAGVRAQIVHEAGQPVDHPVPVHFPEGRYLKFLVLRVLEPA